MYLGTADELIPSPSKEDIQPALPVMGLVFFAPNVNGTCKPPALATGTSGAACSDTICPSLPSIFLCLPLLVASTTTPANSPFPINHLATSPLSDVAFTCCRQPHSLKNYSPPRSLHLFCRDAALCSVSCLRLPQPVCTSPLPLLTQHLLRDCSPAIRPRDLSACFILTFDLSRRLIRAQSAIRLRLHCPRVAALWTRIDAAPFF